MQRYFALISENKVILSNDDNHHLLNVLRAKIGEKIEVVYNGELFLAKINKLSPLEINVLEKLDDNSELKANVGDNNGLEYTTSSSKIGVRGYKSYLHTWKDGQEIDVKEIATTWYTEE